MVDHKFRKYITFLLIGLIIALGLTHAVHPIILSPTSSGDRLSVTFILLFLAWAIYSGYRSARLIVSSVFAFCAAVNLLILLSYFNRMELNSLLEIIFWTTILSGISCLLLVWKGVRVFEEDRKREKQAV